MHTAPMKESDGTFEDGWKLSPRIQVPCRNCGQTGGIKYRVWESSCGGHEDIKYKCDHCGHTWWIEGPDA